MELIIKGSMTHQLFTIMELISKDLRTYPGQDPWTHSLFTKMKLISQDPVKGPSFVYKNTTNQ